MFYELTKTHTSRAKQNTYFILMFETRHETPITIHGQIKERDRRRNDLKKFKHESFVVLTTMHVSIKGKTNNDSECFIRTNKLY